MKVLNFLDPKAIIVELEPCSKANAIKALVDAAMNAGGFDAANREKIIEAVMAREARGSTGLGGGVALPHVKGTPLVDSICGAFARSTEGLDYGSVDGRPCHVFFLILSPESQVDQHISILRGISEIRENEHYLSSFKQADDSEALQRLIGGLGGQG